MNIATIRKRRGLTQVDLAEMTHLTQPTISRAERGEEGTTLATMMSIAAALEVALHELFAPDRPELEGELIRLFRQLPEERQKGWIEMARAAEGEVRKSSGERS